MPEIKQQSSEKPLQFFKCVCMPYFSKNTHTHMISICVVNCTSHCQNCCCHTIKNLLLIKNVSEKLAKPCPCLWLKVRGGWGR